MEFWKILEEQRRESTAHDAMVLHFVEGEESQSPRHVFGGCQLFENAQKKSV
jgi:hypothetical protein